LAREVGLSSSSLVNAFLVVGLLSDLEKVLITKVHFHVHHQFEFQIHHHHLLLMPQQMQLQYSERHFIQTHLISSNPQRRPDKR